MDSTVILRTACAALTAALVFGPVRAADDWQVLFDGSSLEGWTTGGAMDAWVIEDDELVVRPGGGRWLRTMRRYRDFHLELEFLVPEGGNSGVALRSSAHGDPAFTGMEIQILDTHGRDASITFCGAVYDAIPPDVMAVKPAGEWNRYEIHLVGDTLDAWLNDIPIHVAESLDDRGYVHVPDNPSPLRDRLTTGYIALQDHGDPVRFRNIRIRDLSPDPDAGGFEPLFNGRDLDGWMARGEGIWTVEQGVLIGRDGPGHLFSDRSFGDLELRAHVRVNDGGNSGFYFRTVPRPGATGSWPLGYEAQIDQHDPRNFTGCIYDRAWAKKPITRDEAWFDYRIRAVGDRIQTWIDGTPMVNASIADFAEGHVVLQTHHRGNEVRWRDIEVRVITPDGDEETAK